MKTASLNILFFCLATTGCVPVQSVGQTGSPSRVEVNSHAQAQPQSPQLKRLKNGHYRVRKPWTVVFGQHRWQVPAGFRSNGITAPAKIKNYLGDGVEHRETWAAVFHDWLFTQPGITRSQADRLFYELLIAYDVPIRKAAVMRTCVEAYSLSLNVR